MRISTTFGRVLAASAGLALALPAAAADLGGGPTRRFDGTPRAAYQPMQIERWTGLYLGGTLGYGFGTTDIRGDSGSFDFGPAGGVGTLFAGYNWQIGRAVLGVEADIGTGYLDDSLGSGAGQVSQDLNVMGSLRARAGLLLSPAFLVYGTAGLAAADFDFRANGITASETLLGYQVGAGTELMITPNWTLRMEYVYTGFGAERIDHGGISNSYDPDFHTVRAGLSFKF
jgi:outer membrane immunogenic protein